MWAAPQQAQPLELGGGEDGFGGLACSRILPVQLLNPSKQAQQALVCSMKTWGAHCRATIISKGETDRNAGCW